MPHMHNAAGRDCTPSTSIKLFSEAIFKRLQNGLTK